MEKNNLIDLQKRKLKKCYVAVYVVVKDIKVRTDTCISDRELYILFGIDIMGNRQIVFDN